MAANILSAIGAANRDLLLPERETDQTSNEADVGEWLSIAIWVARWRSLIEGLASAVEHEHSARTALASLQQQVAMGRAKIGCLNRLIEGTSAICLEAASVENEAEKHRHMEAVSDVLMNREVAGADKRTADVEIDLICDLVAVQQKRVGAILQIAQALDRIEHACASLDQELHFSAEQEAFQQHLEQEVRVLSVRRDLTQARRSVAEGDFDAACQASGLRREVATVISQCPNRVGDLGGYLSRISNYEAAARLVQLRAEQARDQEAKRCDRYWDKLAPWLKPPSPPKAVRRNSSMRPARPTRADRRVGLVFALSRRVDLLAFAKPDKSSVVRAREWAAEMATLGNETPWIVEKYHGSERQRNARRIHRRSVKRFLQQIARQPFTKGGIDSQPFYLDVHHANPVARLILASDPVREGLLRGEPLSALLTSAQSPVYTWRNRGPCVHAIIAFKPGYSPTDHQLAKLARRYLVALGVDLQRFRFAVIRHEDTDHAHVHVVWSRIRDDGALLSHPSLARDRVCQLLGAVQDCLVAGRAPRDALGGSSWACRRADTLLNEGRLVSHLMLPDGSSETIYLQGDRAAARIAGEGWLDDECLGGFARVEGYWGPRTTMRAGMSADDYLARLGDRCAA